jgi:cell division ATPase FtsA
VWPSALRAAETVAQRLELTLANVVAAPQALATALPQREAILVDVGAQGTSLQLIQHDTLVSATWWPQGGGFFTQSLARTFRCPFQEAEALKRAYVEATLSTRDSDLVSQALAGPVAKWLETLIDRLRQALATQPTTLDARRPGALPARIYLTGGGSLLPDLAQAIKSLETRPAVSFRQSLEISWLGSKLGARARGRTALLDIPPRPTSDLLAPAISLATCLE